MLGMPIGALRTALGPWQTYTPVVVQSGTITAIASVTARYRVLGREVTVSVALTISDFTGAVAVNLVSVSLPVANLSFAAAHYVGQGFIYDQSVDDLFPALVQLNSATTVRLITASVDNASVSGGVALGAVGGFTAALANSDQINFTATYEAAVGTF